MHNSCVSGIEDKIDTNQNEPTQESDLLPLQSDSSVVITVGPTVEEELSIVTV
ncbi:hypothetical protein E2C01_096550 [Portunus trituberculatus]|uniref:Uncharacterized protein n=1 Tax=Portunus trituberculatus TaxID=210409 RepID=A0A5B7K7B2_PORTR|nr:hypothetical protein [Portunus trituberculatus]